MAKEFKNTKVRAIAKSESTGQYILTVVQESPFAGFADSGVEYNITLFSRRNGEVDDSTVERTQETLREQLGDDNIIFTDPRDATKDANHIENWVEENKGSQVALVTQNDNGFFDLGQGMTGGGSFGDSKYLTGYKASDGSYDPTQHRVPFYNSLSDEQRDAVDTIDVTKYGHMIQSSSRSSYRGLEIPGLVVDVILSRANAFGSTPETYTREELREEIVDSLTAGKKVNADNKAIADEIEALPSNFAYVDLLKAIGGAAAEHVKGAKQGSISGLLDNADRTSVRFYIQNPETGYVFQSTDLKAGGTARSLESQNNVQFEFITDDFSQSDLVRFLTNIAGVQNTQLDIMSIFDELVEEGLYDNEAGMFKVDDMTSLLGLLRTLFVGRTVTVQSTLQGSRGRQDKDKLGTNIRGVSLTKDVDAIKTSLITDTNTSDITIGEATPVADEAPANPFAAAAAPKEEVEEVEDVEEDAVDNPFAAAAEETAEEEVVEPEEVDEEEDEDEEDLTNNPFL